MSNLLPEYSTNILYYDKNFISDLKYQTGFQREIFTYTSAANVMPPRFLSHTERTESQCKACGARKTIYPLKGPVCAYCKSEK